MSASLISSLLGGLVIAVAGACVFFSMHGSAQGQGAASTSPPPVAEAARATQSKAGTRNVHSRPSWRELTSEQQTALHPLASVWDELSEQHKRKWLALSRNHARLSPAEQAVQHSRMAEWATLGQQERAQARFNFAEIKQLPADERKAKWEAYQALSASEKRQLAERAPSRSIGVAPTIAPVPARKLAPVATPLHRGASATPQSTPSAPRTADEYPR